PIGDDGSLVFDHSGTVDIANPITGSGNVVYEGGATYIVHGAESYAGGTTVIGGSILTNNVGAFGSGPLTLDNTGFLALTTQSLNASSLIVQSSATISASHGQTLSLPTLCLMLGATLDFGGPGNDGTIVWGSGGTLYPNYDLKVHAGTLAGRDLG